MSKIPGFEQLESYTGLGKATELNRTWHGYGVAESLAIEIPSPGELYETYVRGFISDRDLAFYLRKHGIMMHGASDEQVDANSVPLDKQRWLIHAWNNVALAKGDWPSVSEINELYNRNVIKDDAEWNKWIRRAGVADPDARKLLYNFLREWPTSTDIVHFAVKDVWVNEVVERYQYDAELPPQFEYWHGTAGQGWPFEEPESKLKSFYLLKGASQSDAAKLTAESMKAQHGLTPALAHWRAHWDLMSPSQAFQAFYRCRPSALPRIQAEFDRQIKEWRDLHPGESDQYVKPFSKILPFDIHDLGLHLRVANYAPTSRPWLAAIAYRPLTRVDVRRMRALDVLKRNDVKEAYLDLGYDETNASRLADFVEKDVARAASGVERTKLARGVADSYALRLISRADAAKRLTQILGGAGGVDIRLDAADLAQKVRVAKDVLRVIRRQYTRGIIDLDQTRVKLSQLGIDAAATAQTIAEWDIAFDHRHRELTASQVLTLWKQGILSEDVAVGRLRNLGFSGDDSRYMIDLAYEQEERRISGKRYSPRWQRDGDDRPTPDSLTQASPPIIP